MTRSALDTHSGSFAFRFTGAIELVKDIHRHNNMMALLTNSPKVFADERMTIGVHVAGDGLV